MRPSLVILSTACAVLFAAACSPQSKNTNAPVVWALNNVENIGGQKPELIGGAPTVGAEGGTALRFDGKTQGLLLPVFPLAGLKEYTIELEIFPEAGGEFEQRFFHAGSPDGARVMVELRSNPDGSWYLDTHIRDVASNRVTLIDEKKTHPSDQWYALKVVYDGETITHYVDGIKEGEAKKAIAPMPAGPVSLGVRQNRVCWFKGMMREVRFWPVAR